MDLKKLMTLVLSVCCALPLYAQSKEEGRLKESYNVLRDLMPVVGKEL